MEQYKSHIRDTLSDCLETAKKKEDVYLYFIIGDHILKETFDDIWKFLEVVLHLNGEKELCAQIVNRTEYSGLIPGTIIL